MTTRDLAESLAAARDKGETPEHHKALAARFIDLAALNEALLARLQSRALTPADWVHLEANAAGNVRGALSLADIHATLAAALEMVAHGAQAGAVAP